MDESTYEKKITEPDMNDHPAVQDDRNQVKSHEQKPDDDDEDEEDRDLDEDEADEEEEADSEDEKIADFSEELV